MNAFPARDIFERLLEGHNVSFLDPQYAKVGEVVLRTQRLISRLNATTTGLDETRNGLSDIMQRPIPTSTYIFAPLFTNFGRHVFFGENVIVNHACSMLDMGGITIEDSVMIGPRVNLVTESHPLDPATRNKSITTQPVYLKKGCWIGAGATILPGVTVGENSVVAAGAVVSKNVPPNVVVAGVPAKVVRKIAVGTASPSAINGDESKL